jgi:putative acetyltransferase
VDHTTSILIRDASIPDELPIVRELFKEYAAGLGVDLCFQGFAEELAGLPGKYCKPEGGIWLAFVGDDVAGCVALRPIDDEHGEIKRLFVRSQFRGFGLGRKLAERALQAAAEAGFQGVRLDTLPSMGDAIALYRSLGFTEIAPYCRNPVPGALYFECRLT